jgi:hypothetical protein
MSVLWAIMTRANIVNLMMIFYFNPGFCGIEPESCVPPRGARSWKNPPRRLFGVHPLISVLSSVRERFELPAGKMGSGKPLIKYIIMAIKL